MSERPYIDAHSISTMMEFRPKWVLLAIFGSTLVSHSNDFGTEEQEKKRKIKRLLSRKMRFLHTLEINEFE